MDSITFSEIMEFYPGHNHSVYEELRSACQHGSIIPFVGAGLSDFCGYQGWPDVLKQLAKYVYDSSIRAGIETMIEDGNLLQAAQEIQNNYPLLLKELRKMIDYDKIKNCDQDRLYASAAYVLPYLFGRSPVMTTNFDRVLEAVYDRCHTKFWKVITPYEPDLLTQSLQNNPHCLFKLYGDIGPEIHDIERLIFTQTQYDKVYSDNGPLMQELPQWFQSKKLLFLGYNLVKDRTMDVLQQVMSKNPGLDHYAILACSPNDIAKRCVEMGKLGISAIYYPDGKHEAVRVILERLLEDTNYSAYKELCRYIKKSDSTSKVANRFMYDSNYIAFVGRKEELAQLQEFCQDTEQISWWVVAGPGGIGKSRLVYEFANAQKAEGWEICWLKHSDYDNLIHWMPPADRCIVVADDVQAHLQIIGNWILSISACQRSEKLRIILLERDGKDLNSAKWAELLQAESPYDDTISSKCYCSDFLNLAPLSDDELKTIMMDFAEISAESLADSGHAERLLGTLKKIDGKLKRPIYALAITDAWCSGKDPTRWSKEQILDALVKRELEFYYNRLRSLSSDNITKSMCSELEDLLARSCIVDFLPLDQIADDEYTKLHKRADKLDLTFPELLRQIGIVHRIEVYIQIKDNESKKLVTQEGIIEAIVLDCPDLIKEYLVLRQALNKNRLDLLFPVDWANDPMQLLFLRRILIDYPEKLEGNNQFWTAFFAGDPKLEFSAQIYGDLLFGATVQIPKMEKHTMSRLEKLYYHFHDSKDIAVSYAKGLLNLSAEQTLDGRNIDKLRLLYEQSPASEEIAVSYAKGLVDLSRIQTMEERLLVDKISEFRYSNQLSEGIRGSINDSRLPKELEKNFYTLLGGKLIIDEGFLLFAELANDDRNISIIRSQINKWESTQNIAKIEMLATLKINAKRNTKNIKICSFLIQKLEKLRKYDLALAVIEETQKPYKNKLILAAILRICRKKEDYSFAEKNLNINEAFIDISDFNLQYELVYYFQAKNNDIGLEKTLRRMHNSSATSSIPIARTLYNFYLSLNRFEDAQSIYTHIQQLEQNQIIKHEQQKKGRIKLFPSGSEEQIESEQAVWQRMKELYSEQEHNRQMIALRDLLKGFSHELGQPITNIRYAIQLYQKKIQKKLDTLETLEILLSDILLQTNRIGTLLSRFSPIVSPKNESGEFSVRVCAEKVFDDLDTRLHGQNISYQVDGPYDLTLSGDEVQFSQVFYNLTLNAMQAIERDGHIAINISGSAQNILTIIFSDNGPGIPEQNFQKIFEPFFSTKDPTSGNGGEGLGLYVVWNILKIFNGTIHIDKDFQSGSKFIIEIHQTKGGT